MSRERPQPPVLPFVAAQPLVDHHCHGVLRGGGDLAELLNEADGAAAAGGMAFDTLAGLSFRRWCPPVLGLSAHAPVSAYEERRAALGGDEVNRRFLGPCGLAALCVDTGYTPSDLLSAAETAAFAGGRRRVSRPVPHRARRAGQRDRVRRQRGGGEVDRGVPGRA